jgi:hypothetical protein
MTSQEKPQEEESQTQSQTPNHNPKKKQNITINWPQAQIEKIKQEEAAAIPTPAPAPAPASNQCLVEFITTFFETSTRSENDATNKKRELVLGQIGNPPKEFMEHETFGRHWQYVKKEFDATIATIAVSTNVPQPYTSYQIETKGGRKFNYDGMVKFYNHSDTTTTTTTTSTPDTTTTTSTPDTTTTTPATSRKIEFKYGASNINGIPQFLSLQTKFGMFRNNGASTSTPTPPPTYEVFWYQKHLDKYIACDPQLKCIESDTSASASASASTSAPPKPSLEDYLRFVQKTNYDVDPFFARMKECETNFKKEKAKVVNDSISEYLSSFGQDLDINVFTQKIQESQQDKTYILWGKDMKCHIDAISQEEMSGIGFKTIKNNNAIVLESSLTKTTYSLLLRWRNHKGILNPAWQISLKRIKRN